MSNAVDHIYNCFKFAGMFRGSWNPELNYLIRKTVTNSDWIWREVQFKKKKGKLIFYLQIKLTAGFL